MLNIHLVMQELAKRRPVFHSEADFQFALAWQVREITPDAEVRLEFKPFPDERLYLDVWLPTLGTAMELKYPTRKLEIPYGGEVFKLANQAARDLTRYDYVKDICRLEHVTTGLETATIGLAVILTNDPNLWQPPTRETIDDAFRIHEGRELSGDLAWSERAAHGTTKNREAVLQMWGAYELHWKEYAALNGKYGQFRYLAVEVASPTTPQ